MADIAIGFERSPHNRFIFPRPCTNKPGIFSTNIPSLTRAAAKLSFLIITIVLLGFVLFDIKQNGSFKASQTGQAVNVVIEHKNVKTALASAQVHDQRDGIYLNTLQHRLLLDRL